MKWQKKELLDLYSIQPKDPTEKVSSIKEIFHLTEAVGQTKSMIASYTDNAFKVLDTLEISLDKKELLRTFGENLMERKV